MSATIPRWRLRAALRSSAEVFEPFDAHALVGVPFWSGLLLATTHHVPGLPLRFLSWIFNNGDVAVVLRAAPAFPRGRESREDVGVAIDSAQLFVMLNKHFETAW